MGQWWNFHRTLIWGSPSWNMGFLGMMVVLGWLGIANNDCKGYHSLSTNQYISDRGSFHVACRHRLTCQWIGVRESLQKTMGFANPMSTHTNTQFFAVDKHKHIERVPKNRSVNLYCFHYFINFFISFSFVIPLHTNIYIHTDWLHIRWKWVQKGQLVAPFSGQQAVRLLGISWYIYNCMDRFVPHICPYVSLFMW